MHRSGANLRILNHTLLSAPPDLRRSIRVASLPRHRASVGVRRAADYAIAGRKEDEEPLSS